MKILFVSYWGETAPCGVRVHYLNLATELRRLGHTVDLITPNTLQGSRRRVLSGLQRLVALVAGPEVALDLWYFAMLYTAIPRQADYDLANAHDVGSGAAVRRALHDRIPVVVTGHASEHPAEEIIRRNQLSGLSAGFIRRLYAWLLPQTQYFIGVSDYLLGCFRPFLPDDCVTRRIHGGSPLPASTDSAGSALVIPEVAGRPVILNVGFLDANKNQRYLVEIARELRHLRSDFVVALVGKGPEEATLRQLIADYDLTDHVLLLGYRTDVAPLLRQATVYVHTARLESLGLALVEAVLAGVPVLAPATGGIPEVLGATPEALFAPTTEPALLARRLHLLLADEAARLVLHARQYAHATACFTLPHMAAQTVGFYQETLAHFRALSPSHQAEPASVLSSTHTASSLA
ncbi:glycosyltransferase family 4 protein [Hymenobacter cellulosivorans]|uniref:Glycosyltransferase family 4 protein n=1 Tax=Hymenobacter cellulosivorans TaxID=2932249 RepID=A0ABY4F2U5_9BACT|nr:glycosyltransferase family 4 protein [Hymenobacter cellulosivorans]UOQ50809.1 glycosyltransferase family 4 protein [Hymenobacter cellulosivorans]